MARVVPVMRPAVPCDQGRAKEAVSKQHADTIHASEATPARARSYQQAAIVIVHLARNSAVAVAVAWCANYVITFGNIFAKSSPADQSLVSFTCAVVAWTAVFNATVDTSLHGCSLLHAHLLSHPAKRPTWWWCIGTLLWRTSHWLFITVATCVGVTYAFCAFDSSARKWNLYFYVTVVIAHLYRTRVVQEVRRIFEFETVEGQSRGVVVLDSSWRRLLSKNMSMLVSVYIAIAYVQGATHLDLHSPTAVFVFATVSLVVKLMMQEATVHTAMQRKRIQVDRMHAMIAIPTVLIDTQVRILLLRASQLDQVSASASQETSANHLRWLGSMLLAVFEIVVRVSRTWWLHTKIRRRWYKRNLPRKRTVMLATNSVHSFNASEEASKLSELSESSMSGSDSQFQLWKMRRLALYAAEAQADMHAEYIAIGCSLSIYYFYHGHPKFSIDTGGKLSAPSRISSSYAEVIAFQVTTELLVDFICTTVEIASGVSFKVPRNMNTFLVSLYIACALGNITLSSTMFLKCDERGS